MVLGLSCSSASRWDSLGEPGSLYAILEAADKALAMTCPPCSDQWGCASGWGVQSACGSLWEQVHSHTPSRVTPAGVPGPHTVQDLPQSPGTMDLAPRAFRVLDQLFRPTYTSKTSQGRLGSLTTPGILVWLSFSSRVHPNVEEVVEVTRMP